MLYRKQTVIGWPHGNCVSASWANFFGVPFESVPAFDPASVKARGETQHESERKWLRSMGFDMVTVPCELPLSVHPNTVGFRIPAELSHLMTVESPRVPGAGHRVIGKGGSILFDQHPEPLPIKKVRNLIFVVKVK